jgi:hypothetical protein
MARHKDWFEAVACTDFNESTGTNAMACDVAQSLMLDCLSLALTFHSRKNKNG